MLPEFNVSEEQNFVDCWNLIFLSNHDKLLPITCVMNMTGK